MLQKFEARVTVRQKLDSKPDYHVVHTRMAQAGLTQLTIDGKVVLHELGGIYQHPLTSLTIEQVNDKIDMAFSGYPHEISVEIVSIGKGIRRDLLPASSSIASSLTAFNLPLYLGMLEGRIPSLANLESTHSDINGSLRHLAISWNDRYSRKF
jgi:hypothetical protein